MKLRETKTILRTKHGTCKTITTIKLISAYVIKYALNMLKYTIRVCNNVLARKLFHNLKRKENRQHTCVLM